MIVSYEINRMGFSEKDFIILAIIIVTITSLVPILVQVFILPSLVTSMRQQVDQPQPQQIQEILREAFRITILAYGSAFATLAAIVAIWYVKVKRRRMLTCPKCGNKVTPDIAICPYCGGVIGPETRSSPASRGTRYSNPGAIKKGYQPVEA